MDTLDAFDMKPTQKVQDLLDSTSSIIARAEVTKIEGALAWIDKQFAGKQTSRKTKCDAQFKLLTRIDTWEDMLHPQAREHDEQRQEVEAAEGGMAHVGHHSFGAMVQVERCALNIPPINTHPFEGGGGVVDWCDPGVGRWPQKCGVRCLVFPSIAVA